MTASFWFDDVKAQLAALDARVGSPVVRLAASPTARRVATGAFWTVFGSGASRLLALIAAVLLARRLGPASFGEYNLVQTTAGMMMALGGFGLNTTTTKFLAGKYRADPAAAGRVVGLSGVVSAAVGGGTGVLLAVLAPWVARDVLGSPQLTPALRVGSLLLLFGPINGTQLGVLMGLERFRLIAGLTTLAAALSIPLVVAGAWWDGMFGATVGAVASSAIGTIMYRRAVYAAARRVGIRPLYRDALKEWRLLFSYSLPMTLTNVVVAPVTWVGSAFVANQLGGVRELGLYAAANQWRNAIMLVATSAGAVLFPLFAHLHDSGRARSFARAFWTSLGLTAAVSALGAAALAGLAPWLMHLYGHGFVEASGVLVLLVIAGALSAPLSIVGHAIAGAGRMWLGLALSVVWAAVLVSTSYVLRTRGALGLSIAHVAAYGVHLLVALAFASAIVRGRGAAPPVAEPGDVATEQAGA
ncbi:MAG TPA: oligosaccharide flippase family protein [Anaeromyxobacter sp.]|jgi:O-antigen/teichoic acid export membrane protein|nr:oligosaccharide flippase family protein [Anaeromyxobacter sp.]